MVRPGERIAADGEVEFGQSAVDRAVMTGESVPADVAEGDAVTADTVVVAGRLVVRAVKVGAGTQLAHLVALVEQAQSQKAAIQRLADRICGVFVPAVLVASAVTLAGDSHATAQAVAAEAGTDEVIAGALPGHKVDVIRGLQAQGHRVAMVGDGVNDGSALATADLGLALGTGTDVAISAADLILLRDDLGAVPDAIALARGTLAVIRLSVRLQHRRDPAGGRRLPQPVDRWGGDGRVVSLRRRQQRAAAAVRRPGCPPPLAAAAPCRT